MIEQHISKNYEEKGKPVVTLGGSTNANKWSRLNDTTSDADMGAAWGRIKGKATSWAKKTIKNAKDKANDNDYMP